MRDVDTSPYTKILRVLGKYGPMSAQDLKYYTGMKSVQSRISEFNRVYTNIEIGKTKTFPIKYYIRFPSDVKISYNTIYPHHTHNCYSLNNRKRTILANKGTQ